METGQREKEVASHLQTTNRNLSDFIGKTDGRIDNGLWGRMIDNLPVDPSWLSFSYGGFSVRGMIDMYKGMFAGYANEWMQELITNGNLSVRDQIGRMYGINIGVLPFNNVSLPVRYERTVGAFLWQEFNQTMQEGAVINQVSFVPSGRLAVKGRGKVFLVTAEGSVNQNERTTCLMLMDSDPDKGSGPEIVDIAQSGANGEIAWLTPEVNAAWQKQKQDIPFPVSHDRTYNPGPILTAYLWGLVYRETVKRIEGSIFCQPMDPNQINSYLKRFGISP